MRVRSIAVDPRRLLLAGALLAAVLLLGVLRTTAPMHHADVAVADAMPGLRTTATTRAVAALERVLAPGVTGLVAFVVGARQLVLGRQGHRLAMRLVVVALLALCVVPAAKGVFRAARPSLDVQSGHVTSWGYPSGHAATDVAIALVVVAAVRRSCAGRDGHHIVAAVLVLVGLVAVGRVYSNAHYTTDVIGGVLLGGALANAALACSPRSSSPRAGVAATPPKH